MAVNKIAAKLAGEVAKIIAEQMERQEYRLETDNRVDLDLTYAQGAFLVNLLREQAGTKK